METRKRERSLGELFSELAHESAALVRQEIDLAKAELSEKLGQAAGGAASVATGGGVLFAGALLLLAAIIAFLSTLMEAWLAALIVGVVLALIGLLLFQRGRSSLSARNLAPRKTARSLRRDTEIVREKVR